jgi:hypothetical protein
VINFFKGAMIIRIGNYYFTWSIYGEVHPRRYNLPRFYWFVVTDLGNEHISINAPGDVQTDTILDRLNRIVV